MAVIQAAMNLLASVQTEVTIFLLALVVHWLLFSKWRLNGKSQVIKRASKPGKSPKSAIPAAPPPHTQTSPLTLSLARQVKPLLLGAGEQEAIERVLAENLQNKSGEETAASLAGLLEHLGTKAGAAQPELLAAVRCVLSRRGLKHTGRLTEVLLRGFLFARQQEHFDEVFAEVDESASSSKGVASLALRAALCFSDFDAALRRLPAFSSAMQGVQPSTASSAPQQLVQQLVQVAIDKDTTDQLLQALCDCGLFVPWVVEIVTDAAQQGRGTLLEKTLSLARAQDLELTAGTRAMLIRRASSAEEATRLLSGADASSATSPSLLLAAAEVARAHQDTVLASTFLKMLPDRPTIEVAVAALHLCAEGLAVFPSGEQSADEAVLKLYEERLAGAVDISADVSAGHLIAEAALRRGRSEALQRLLVTFKETPRQVALLKSLGAQKKSIDDAIKVFKACPTKTTCLYNALLDMCIECGDARAADWIMKEAADSGLADVITYNTSIKAHLQGGNTQKARATIEAMRTAGLEPNVVTFNELLDETTKNNRQGGWDVIEEMKAFGLKPNQVTCSILLKNIQRNSRISDIERTLALMDDLDAAIDEVLVSSLFEACIRAGQGELLAKQLRRHRGPGSVKVQGAHTFGSIIRAYGFVKDIAGVWDTWSEMRSRRILPTSITLGCMVEALCLNDSPEAGYKLIQEVVSDEEMKPLLNSIIYSSVLKGFSHQKKFDLVWKVYDEMVKEKLQFSITTFNTLIDACARSCNMARVPDFLQEMSNLKIEPNVITYSTIVKGYCQENRLDKAFDLLEDMKKTRQFLPDEITYNTLLDGCARHGYYDRGMALLEDMEKSKVYPSNFTLSVLVKLCNRGNRLETAFELSKDLCKKYNLKLNIHVYSNLIHACTQHWDLPRALTVFQQLLQERIRPDVRTYSILLRACVAAGEAQEASSLLRAAAGRDHRNPKLASFPSHALRPSEALPADLVSEILETLAGKLGQRDLAMNLVKELQGAHGIKLDPKLSARLAAKAMRQM